MNRCHGLLGPQNGSDLPSALGLVNGMFCLHELCDDICFDFHKNHICNIGCFQDEIFKKEIGFVEFVVRCLLPSFEERRDLVRFDALSTFPLSGKIVFSPNKNT